MLKKIILLFVVTVLVVSCGQSKKQKNTQTEKGVVVFEVDEHQNFINNLNTLCGKSFPGEEIYRSHHGDSWAQQNMTMHVTVCDSDKVHIPFHIDDDHSRTWMFVAEDGKLHFKHQHLHDDGTPEEGSMYGGYADNNGTAFIQYFPADEYTGQVIDGGAGNVWIVSMDEELTWYSYRLDRDGEQRLEIRFDLTQPIEQ